MKRFIKAYWWDLALGFLLLLADNIGWFLFFVFLNLLYVMDVNRRIIGLAQLSSDVKNTAMLRKLKITDDEIEIVLDSFKEKMSKEQWKLIESDIKDLIAKN